MEQPIRTRLDKCPGGVALVIPDAVARDAGLEPGTVAHLELTPGGLVLRAAPQPTLAERLALITPETLHGEWLPTPPSGKELL